MTTEESRESLDRAVEEARAALWIVLPEGVWPEVRVAAEAVNDAISHLEAAVSERARAEERERLLAVLPCPHPTSEVYWVDDSRSICAMCGADSVEPARSSEEAEVCLHPRVSRMAAVGGPIICGVCGEEAGG